MSAPQVEEDLKRDLQAIDALYPDDIEPPAAADDAIRAAARRAVRAKPGGESFWWPKTPPLAAAAVLVLTVSIAFLAMDDPIVQDLMREPDVPAARVEVVPAPMPPAQVAPVDAPARVAAPEPAAQAARPVADAARAAVSKQSAASERARGEEIRAQPARVAQPQPVPLAPPPPPPASPRFAAPAAAPAPAEPAPVAVAEAPAPAAPVSPARTPAANEIVLAPKDDPRLKAFAKKETYVASPEKPAADLAVAAKVAASPQQADVAKEAAASAPRMTAASAGPTPVATVPAATVPAPVAAAPIIIKNPPAALLQDAQLMPDLWLKRIQLLKSEGKVKEAEEELVKFRKRYPDYPLPESLKPKDSPPQK